MGSRKRAPKVSLCAARSSKPQNPPEGCLADGQHGTPPTCPPPIWNHNFPRMTSSPRSSRQAGTLSPTSPDPTTLARISRERVQGKSLRKHVPCFQDLQVLIPISKSPAPNFLPKHQVSVLLLLAFVICPFSASQSLAGSLGEEAQLDLPG